MIYLQHPLKTSSKLSSGVLFEISVEEIAYIPHGVLPAISFEDFSRAFSSIHSRNILLWISFGELSEITPRILLVVHTENCSGVFQGFSFQISLSKYYLLQVFSRSFSSEYFLQLPSIKPIVVLGGLVATVSNSYTESHEFNPSPLRSLHLLSSSFLSYKFYRHRQKQKWVEKAVPFPPTVQCQSTV